MSLPQTLDGQIIFIPSMARHALRDEIAAMVYARGAMTSPRLHADVTFAVFEGLCQGKAKYLKSFWQVLDADIPFMDGGDFLKALRGEMSIADALHNGSAYKPEPEAPPSHQDLFDAENPLKVDIDTSQGPYCV